MPYRFSKSEFRILLGVATFGLLTMSALCSGYLTDAQTSTLLSNRTIYASTARDHEQWKAFFSGSGQVTYIYADGSTASGTWYVRESKVFIQMSGPLQCKHIFVDDSQSVHWKNCGDELTTSYLNKVSNGNSLYAPEPLGPEQAAMLAIVRQFLGGLVQNVPEDVPVKPLFDTVMYDLIDPEIASHLNEQDKRLAIQAIIASLQAGEDHSWNNPDTDRHGDINILSTYQDSTGRICRVYDTKAWLEDGTEYSKRRNACFDTADNAWIPVG